MRRTVVGLIVVVLMALASVNPAAAHTTGPCADSGEPGHSDYARHHIVTNAQAGNLGNDGHVPGSHKGYSACNPSGNLP